MSNRRILILTNRVPYPLNDGGNLAMQAMINGYHSAGWQVYLLAMNTSRHFLGGDILGSIYTNIFRFETVPINNDVKPVPTLVNFLFSKQPNHAERFQSEDFKNAIKEAIVLFKPDIVHVESVFLTSYLPLIKRLTNATTVLRMHNIEWQVWERLAKASTGVKRIYLTNLAKRIRKYEPQAWGQYDFLLPITSVDAAMVARVLPQAKLHIVPFGIKTDSLSPQYIGDWVGYHIGAMDWLPNAEGISWFLKEAWPIIHRQHPEFNFHFAGRNMPESFQKFIAGVTCYGEVQDANTFIANKRILIVPLRSGGGIRVKILEAMVMGKVVVSTAIGMQGIDATAGVHFLEANTAVEFANTIDWILLNKEKAETIGQNSAALIRDKYDVNLIQIGLLQWLEANIEG